MSNRFEEGTQDIPGLGNLGGTLGGSYKEILAWAEIAIQLHIHMYHTNICVCTYTCVCIYIYLYIHRYQIKLIAQRLAQTAGAAKNMHYRRLFKLGWPVKLMIFGDYSNWGGQ